MALPWPRSPSRLPRQQPYTDSYNARQENNIARITGVNFYNDFKRSLAAVRLPTDIDFMAGQPMVFHRRHFEETRQYITSGFQAEDFDEAFSLLTHAVHVNASGSVRPGIKDLPCHQALMGAYLWEYHQAEYSWHILGLSRGATQGSLFRECQSCLQPSVSSRNQKLVRLDASQF